MAYPSLLYYVKPTKRPMTLNVFEDLQLLNFIPKSVAKSVLVPCQKENILQRQSFFKMLENPENREKLAKISELSDNLYSLNKAFSEAGTKVERAFIFLFLAQALREFSECAAECDFSDSISKRFASAFKSEISGDKYQKMCLSLDRILPSALCALTNCIQVGKDTLKASSGSKVTFLNRIESCAEKLGIEKPRVKNPESRSLSPDIIISIASLNPSLMKELYGFINEFESYYDPKVIHYRKESRFYLTMMSLFDRVRAENIPLIYPQVAEKRIISVSEAYDISLLAKDETNIIPNDIMFNDAEPFFFLTGANGGGKTTYLRTVGITVVLFLLRCPTPCVSASIGDMSSVFTHFPRDERFDGSGRFVEENNRVKEITSVMDENSLVLLNETYSTTNEENAVFMTEKLANEIFEKNIFGLYITHQHSLSESKIPYLNVLIDKDDENRRTFKIARQKSEGGSYARDILIRCGLNIEALEARFGSLEETEGMK